MMLNHLSNLIIELSRNPFIYRSKANKSESNLLSITFYTLNKKIQNNIESKGDNAAFSVYILNINTF